MKKSRKINVSEYKSSNYRRKAQPYPNIMSQRLTIPASFLNSGITSEIVHKLTPPEQKYKENVLNEDLHCLLSQNPKIRRSKRIKESKNKTTASAYFQQVIESPSLLRHSRRDSAIRNTTKSRFHEIRTKFHQKIDFHRLIFNQIAVHYEVKPRASFQAPITAAIDEINACLQGAAEMSTNSGRKRQNAATVDDDNKENIPIKYACVPKKNWVFQTPPNRKLNFNHVNVVDNGSMQAAVMEKNGDGHIVYEMNRKINVDLSNFHNRQEIQIDKRYMVPVNNNTSQTEQCEMVLTSNPYELEQHFLNLTCRPKKSLKRKCVALASDTVAGSGNVTPPTSKRMDIDRTNFDANFVSISNPSVLDDVEESFTFEFTAEDKGTTGHLFDFDGNAKDSFNFQF